MTAVRTTLTSQSNSDAPLGGLTPTAVCFQFLDRRGSVNERKYRSLAPPRNGAFQFCIQDTGRIAQKPGILGDPVSTPKDHRAEADG